MKILEYIHEGGTYSTIYIGNEFSPDPLDMLQKINSITTDINTKSTFDRVLNVNTRNFKEYVEVQESVKSLLTKNGYVEYNPCIVNIHCKE